MEKIIERLEVLEKIWNKFPAWKFYFVVSQGYWYLAISNDHRAKHVRNGTVHGKKYGEIVDLYTVSSELKGVLEVLEPFTLELPEMVADKASDDWEERTARSKERKAKLAAGLPVEPKKVQRRGKYAKRAKAHQ